MPRVLVFTARVGEGHEVPARAIEQGIRTREPSATIDVVDALDVLGGLVDRFARDSMQRIVTRPKSRPFDAQYLLFARTPPLRAAGQAALHQATGGRVLREIERLAPDVVVSTYPAMSDVLGFLRRTGRLAVPAVSAITDLSGLWYWASRGLDLHLITHPESACEVERIAGPGRIVAARGLYDERFLAPPERVEARRSLGLLADGPVITISGGGWGVGDIEGAARVAATVPGATVLALTGRNQSLRAQLERSLPGVRALPFVEDMATVLAAADVLVHSTAGLTVLEALLVGCRPISFGWGVGHVRLNNRAFARTGLARVARTTTELRSAVGEALAQPRRPLAAAFARFPHAADLIMGLVDSEV